VDAQCSLQERRVLVVGINYAPEHTGIAPYTTQACDYLAAAGAEVLALAGVPHYPHWSVPEQYRWRLRTNEQQGRVAVRRLRHVVPPRQTARSRASYEATFGAQVLRQRLPWQPDVVLAVVPSLFGAAAISARARLAGAPVVLWVQDLMGPAAAQSGISGGDRIARATSTLERWLLRHAEQVVVVSAAFRPYVIDAGVAASVLHVVPNWTHVAAAHADRAAVRRRLGWARDEVIALHSGNMGLKQGLENLIDAAMQAGPALRIVLMGDGSQRAELQQRGAGVPALQFLPPADSADFPDVLAAADVLLVNERASAVDMSLPSKLTSYFSAGVPVLAAVPPGGGTASEVQRSGAGRLVPPEDPKALVEALRELGVDSEERARLGAAGIVHAREHLSAEASLAGLKRVLCDAIERQRQPRTGPV
jgi:colanic acid biosynthesis glycosyl transferase WcaI